MCRYTAAAVCRNNNYCCPLSQPVPRERRGQEGADASRNFRKKKKKNKRKKSARATRVQSFRAPVEWAGAASAVIDCRRAPTSAIGGRCARRGGGAKGGGYGGGGGTHAASVCGVSDPRSENIGRGRCAALRLASAAAAAAAAATTLPVRHAPPA